MVNTYFIEQVKMGQPSVELPCESQWVHFQIRPRNQFAKLLMCYTGWPNIQHMVQAGQPNHQHVDEHCVAAVVQYLPELAVKFQDISTGVPG